MRFLDDHIFKRFRTDFRFLFNLIRDSKGELDLKLRRNYFNLYYKGNSLARVNFDKEGYLITIHNSFLRVGSDDFVYNRDSRFEGLFRPASEFYTCFTLPVKLLRPFFQSKYLRKVYSNIKNVNYSEELIFEQMIITDNLNRDDFFIIDRQVTERNFKRRMDLLAIEQVGKSNKYRFVILEIKIGNNPELKQDVADQLKSYLKHINSHFDVWKDGYEKNYRQIKQTGIFDKPGFEEVEIVDDTKGLVVVGGYSGIAAASLKNLKKLNKDIDIKQFKYTL